MSVLAINTSLWPIGHWKGEHKLAAQDYISKVGNAHYFFVIGFLLASITVLLDWKLSIVVMLLNLLLAKVLLFNMASTIFNIPAKKVFPFTSLSFISYLALLALLVFLVF